MEKQLELIVRNDDNKLVLASVVNELINVCESEANRAYEQYDALKDELLKAMIDNNLKKAETDDYKISIRENNSKWVFDEERFKNEESVDIVIACTKTEKTRECILNVDKLKEKYPNVYEDCLEIKETEVSTIDTDKLWKLLPNIYMKYATEIKPEKIGTISIKRKE